MKETYADNSNRAQIDFDFAIIILFSYFLFRNYGVYQETEGGAGMPQSLTDIQMVLAPVFAAYGISRAVLFGSVAKGTATEKSDLDLLVDSKLQGLKFVGFMEAVRQAVGMPVDIFDVRHIEKDSKIDREICSTGVTIYEK